LAARRDIELRMSASFTNRDGTNRLQHPTATRTSARFTHCQKKLDEKVARLHLDKLGVKADEVVPGPGGHLGVRPKGPYKLGALPH